VREGSINQGGTASVFSSQISFLLWKKQVSICASSMQMTALENIGQPSRVVVLTMVLQHGLSLGLLAD
jgi:hypothetical protein